MSLYHIIVIHPVTLKFTSSNLNNIAPKPSVSVVFFRIRNFLQEANCQITPDILITIVKLVPMIFSSRLYLCIMPITLDENN